MHQTRSLCPPQARNSRRSNKVAIEPRFKITYRRRTEVRVVSQQWAAAETLSIASQVTPSPQASSVAVNNSKKLWQIPLLPLSKCQLVGIVALHRLKPSNTRAHGQPGTVLASLIVLRRLQVSRQLRRCSKDTHRQQLTRSVNSRRPRQEINSRHQIIPIPQPQQRTRSQPLQIILRCSRTPISI